MYIKIEVEFLDTAIYKINTEKFCIGAADTNHIILKLPSISKKHVTISIIEGKWFVTDLGSTNGTYIGDQKIAKNKRIGFLPDEAVRMGDAIYFTIIEHADVFVELPAPLMVETEEDVPKSDHDKTQVISLTALEKARLHAARKKKKLLLEKKAEGQKRKLADKEIISKVLSAIFIILLTGWVANKIWISQMKKVDKESIVKKMQSKFSGDLEIEADLEGLRIPRKALESRGKISKYLLAPKCTQDQTKDICELSPMFKMRNNGVIFQVPNTYFFFLEEKNYLNLIQPLLSAEDKPGHKAFCKFSFLNFFKDYISGLELDEDAKIYVAFYRYTQDGNLSLAGVSAYNHNKAGMMMSLLNDIKFPGPYPHIEKALPKLDVYYTFY
jgi:pSer/pThr/pTyr-binding forkhead associated (FHA) protein